MTTQQALYLAVNGRDPKFSICPWQSVRRMSFNGKPIAHWQIDLILTQEELVNYNPAEMSMDLQWLYYGHGKDSPQWNLPKKYKYVNQHSAFGTFWPLFQKTTYTPPQVGKTHDLLDLGRGWQYQMVDKGWDFLTAVREEKDGTFELSGAMFSIAK